MIKGWRNNPEWVSYYAKVKLERDERRIKMFDAACRLKTAHEWTCHAEGGYARLSPHDIESGWPATRDG